MSVLKISNFQKKILIYYSTYLSSKLCIGVRNMVNCVIYYGTEGIKLLLIVTPIKNITTSDFYIQIEFFFIYKFSCFKEFMKNSFHVKII